MALDEKYAVLPKIRIDGLTAYNETAFKNSHCRTSSPQKRSLQILHFSQVIKAVEVMAGGCTISLPVTVTFCHRFITEFFHLQLRLKKQSPSPATQAVAARPLHLLAVPQLPCCNALRDSGGVSPPKGSWSQLPTALRHEALRPGGAEVREALKARHKTQVLTSSLTNTSWPSSFHTAGAWQALLTPCNTAIFRLGLKGTVSTC